MSRGRSEVRQAAHDSPASGRYRSKSEQLRDRRRLVQKSKTLLTELDAAIGRGLADADAGRSKPASEVFERLEAKFTTGIRRG